MNIRHHGIFILLYFLNFIGACKSPADQAEPPLINSNRDTTATPVRTALCTEGLFEFRIEANGIFKAEKSLKMIAESSGRILDTRATNGAVIHAGEAVIHLDTTDLVSRREALEIKRYQAEKEFESQLLAYEKLFLGMDEPEKKTVRKKLYIASGLALAELELKDLNQAIHKAVIFAPFGGKVADTKHLAGQNVQAGNELFTLLSHSLLIECQVLEADLPQIRIGQSADILPVADPGITVKGMVHGINPLVSPNGMALVAVKVQGSWNHKLYPGMHGLVVIKIPYRKSLQVPKEALVIRGNRQVVFTMENNQAKWNYVEAGRNNGIVVEILSGLKPGDRVITTNNLQLAHEARVMQE